MCKSGPGHLLGAQNIKKPCSSNHQTQQLTWRDIYLLLRKVSLWILLLVIKWCLVVTSELKYLTVDPRPSHMTGEPKLTEMSQTISFPLLSFGVDTDVNLITYNRAIHMAFPFFMPNFEITIFLLSSVGFSPNEQDIARLFIRSKSWRRRRMLVRHEFGDYKVRLTHQREVSLLFYKRKGSCTVLPAYFLATQRTASGT